MGSAIGFTRDDYRQARAWWDRDATEPLGIGTVPLYVLNAWKRAGKPQVVDVEERNRLAVVQYRRIDRLGRLNGPVREAIATREGMAAGRGRPAIGAYVRAAGLSEDNAHVERVITKNGNEYVPVQVDGATTYVRSNAEVNA